MSDSENWWHVQDRRNLLFESEAASKKDGTCHPDRTRRAVTDCLKLACTQLAARGAVLIYGFRA